MENVPLLAILLIGGSFFCVIAFGILGPLYLKIMLLLWDIIIICLRIFKKRLHQKASLKALCTIYMRRLYLVLLLHQQIMMNLVVVTWEQ